MVSLFHKKIRSAEEEKRELTGRIFREQFKRMVRFGVAMPITVGKI